MITTILFDLDGTLLPMDLLPSFILNIMKRFASPILQDGKMVGLNEPTRGYGIFAENMLETANQVEEQVLKDSS